MQLWTSKLISLVFGNSTVHNNSVQLSATDFAALRRLGRRGIVRWHLPPPQSASAMLYGWMYYTEPDQPLSSHKFLERN